MKNLTLKSQLKGSARIQKLLKNCADLIFLPADRYEILAAANVALVNNIPIAHYAGGQITEGAWDNSIRHAVSKISHLHFVATKNCKKGSCKWVKMPQRYLFAVHGS